jgi:hypothetical protein
MRVCVCERERERETKVKLSLFLNKDDAIQKYETVEAFLTSTLDGGEWSSSSSRGRVTTSGTCPLYLLNKRQGGPKTRSGPFGGGGKGRKKSFSLQEVELHSLVNR